MDLKDASRKTNKIRTLLFLLQGMEDIDVVIDLKTSSVKDSERALCNPKSWKEVSTDVNQEHELLQANC
jgi:hypothetical protein|tara:strand:- start:77 stop:283 length:207 start_codon:yes stop_codon:yes gene_type:complete